MRQTISKVNTFLVITKYNLKIRIDRRPYVIIRCERGEKRTQKSKGDEVPVKRLCLYEIKKCDYPFKF